MTDLRSRPKYGARRQVHELSKRDCRQRKIARLIKKITFLKITIWEIYDLSKQIIYFRQAVYSNIFSISSTSQCDWPAGEKGPSIVLSIVIVHFHLLKSYLWAKVACHDRLLNRPTGHRRRPLTPSPDNLFEMSTRLIGQSNSSSHSCQQKESKRPERHGKQLKADSK